MKERKLDRKGMIQKMNKMGRRMYAGYPEFPVDVSPSQSEMELGKICDDEMYSFPIKILSKALGEDFVLHEDGAIAFDCGVVYEREEWEKLEGISDEELMKIHVVKRVFTEKNPYVDPKVQEFVDQQIKKSAKIIEVNKNSETCKKIPKKDVKIEDLLPF